MYKICKMYCVCVCVFVSTAPQGWVKCREHISLYTVFVTNKVPLLLPLYVQDFTLLGSLCHPRTCCSCRWQTWRPSTFLQGAYLWPGLVWLGLANLCDLVIQFHDYGSCTENIQR